MELSREESGPALGWPPRARPQPPPDSMRALLALLALAALLAPRRSAASRGNQPPAGNGPGRGAGPGWGGTGRDGQVGRPAGRPPGSPEERGAGGAVGPELAVLRPLPESFVTGRRQGRGASPGLASLPPPSVGTGSRRGSGGARLAPRRASSRAAAREPSPASFSFVPHAPPPPQPPGLCRVVPPR